MKNKMTHFIAKNLLPLLVLDIMRFVRHRKRCFLYFWSLARRNQKLKDRHKGEECFILGNGPSLNQHDIRKLKGKTIFAVNFFNLHPDCEEISPKYYAFCDRDCFVDNFAIKGQRVVDRDQWFADIKKKCPNAEFLLPIEFWPLITKKRWFEGRKIWWIPLNNLSHFFDPTNLCTGIMPPTNVTADMALPSAIYMGFSKITILGCELDWLLPAFHSAEAKEYGHFYQKNAHITQETSIGDMRLDKAFADLSEALSHFYILAEMAKRKGCKIVNATPHGLLHMFERVRFDDVASES